MPRGDTSLGAYQYILRTLQEDDMPRDRTTTVAGAFPIYPSWYNPTIIYTGADGSMTTKKLKQAFDHGCNPLCKECFKNPREKVRF